jgi:predicted nucleic acid-binding protein
VVSPATAVIDASALAAILFGEPEADSLDLDLSPDQLIASPMLPHEFANICVRKHQRAGVPIDNVLLALRDFESLGIATEAVSLPETVAAAIRFGLSSYDAGYLWLALIKELPLLTLDKKLAAAYSKALKEIA